MSILLRFSGADEFAAPAASGVLEEDDGWAGLYRTMVGVALVAALASPVAAQTQWQFGGHDEFGNLHLQPTVDEDFPGPLPAPQLWWTSPGVFWGEAAELPQIQGDEETGGVFSAPRLWPTSGGVFWGEDDQVPTVPPPTLGVEDEYWQQLVAPTTWTPPVQANTDDGNDLGNLHAAAAVDEDYPGPLPPPHLWRTNPGIFWGDGDEVPTVPPPTINVEDEYWQQLVPPVRWVPPVQASSDDGSDLGNLHAFPTLDEDYAPSFHVWPVSTGRAFTADDVLPPSMVEDDGWLPPPPAPLACSMPQPWAGDQHEIVPQPAMLVAEGDEGYQPGPFTPWPRPRPILWEDAAADLVPSGVLYGPSRLTGVRLTAPGYSALLVAPSMRSVALAAPQLAGGALAAPSLAATLTAPRLSGVDLDPE